MKANEILLAARMFARVKDLLHATELYNKNTDGDYLFVNCRANNYYTNNSCDIMECCDSDKEEDYYSLDSIDEVAAKFVELALESGANCVYDFYLSF